MSDHGNARDSPMDQPPTNDSGGQPPPKAFRFKSNPSTTQHSSPPNNPPPSNDARRHRHHHHHHSHRPKRHKPSSSPSSPPPAPLSPSTAFRESLFDAMGDDEGAAYWQSVYGQPIHTYPTERRNETTGQLETMDEEDYVAYVRRGMWERSREGVEAEREERRKVEERRRRTKRRRQERDGKRERRGPEDSEYESGNKGDVMFEAEVERSLKRGLERRERKMWRERWEGYVMGWEEMNRLATSMASVEAAVTGSVGIGVDDDDDEANANGKKKKKKEKEKTTLHLRNQICWPVESGKKRDVNPSEIERFMVKTAEALSGGHGPGMGADTLQRRRQQQQEQQQQQQILILSNLKLERVRWHPDKVQQRFGGGFEIDEGTLRGVTEVFQVMDRLYGEQRRR